MLYSGFLGEVVTWKYGLIHGTTPLARVDSDWNLCDSVSSVFSRSDLCQALGTP